VTTRYRYRASTARGEVVHGVAEVASRQALLEQLRRRELYPVAVDELPAGDGRRPRRLPRRTAVTLWARNFATLLGAAVPVDRALETTTVQTGHDGLTEALAAVRAAVQGGAHLSDALARHPAYFPTIVPAMVRAGESSGALDVVFAQLADYLDETAELRAQVRTALLYPALMAVVASVGVSVLLLFVVPRFAVILQDVGGSLPISTLVLVWAGEALSRYWWLWLPLAAALIVGLIELMRRPDVTERWHRWRLGLPLVGDLESKFIAARLTRTLGLLLRNGLPMIPALRVARSTVANVAVLQRLDEAIAAVSEGGTLAAALQPVLPPLARQMLAIGEESGGLEGMCLRIADTFDNEVRRSVRSGVALIEPAMILLFGALVGFVALAMLQAVYSINTNVF
jgi:general secretion pathway protein F